MRPLSLVGASAGCSGRLHRPDIPPRKSKFSEMPCELTQPQKEQAQCCEAYWCGLLHVGLPKQGAFLALTSPHTAKPSTPASPHRTMLMMQQMPKKICTPASIQHTKL